MARVEYPSVETAEARNTADTVRQQRGGRFPNLFRMQLYNTAIVDGWLRLGTAVRFKSELDDATREIAICLVARLTGAEYEWRGHRHLASKAGFSDAQLEGILSWRTLPGFDAKQQAALALAEGLTKNVEVDDATFDAARAHLTPRQLVELVTAISYYNMVARFLVGLQIDLET